MNVSVGCLLSAKIFPGFGKKERKGLIALVVDFETAKREQEAGKKAS